MTRIGVDEDLPSLAEWLRADDALDRARVRSARPVLQEGHMGAVADVLEVALGSGGTLTALASSLAVWIHSRRRRITVTIDGRQAEFDGVDDVDALARRVLELMQEDR
jgi:hypothetical protein